MSYEKNMGNIRNLSTELKEILAGLKKQGASKEYIAGFKRALKIVESFI